MKRYLTSIIFVTALTLFIVIFPATPYVIYGLNGGFISIFVKVLGVESTTSAFFINLVLTVVFTYVYYRSADVYSKLIIYLPLYFFLNGLILSICFRFFKSFESFVLLNLFTLLLFSFLTLLLDYLKSK